MARTARLLRLRLIPAAGAALALALSGCAAGHLAQTAQQVAAVDGANVSAGPVGIRDARIEATEETGYEAGSDAELKLWVANSATSSDTLTAVSSPAAPEAVISSSKVEIAGQTLTEIGPDKSVQITLKGLSEPLVYGHSVPVTFTFQQSGAVTVNVPIEIPQQRAPGSRETVNVLPAEHGNIWFGEEGGAEGERQGSEAETHESGTEPTG